MSKISFWSLTKKVLFEEQPDFNFNDKTHLIIYNASAYREEKDTEIKSILKFISNQQADTPFTNKLKNSVELTKQIPDFGGLYMQFLDDIDELEFNAESRGKEEKALETANNLLDLGKLSKEEISQCTGLPIEKIEELSKVVAGKSH